jgi:hypothetical protein
MIDEWDFRPNEHCFASFANCQTEVAHQRAAGVYVQRFERNPGRLQRDRVRPGGDRSALNKSSRRIEHTSLENRQGLRVGSA